jgi:hypothetical protein
MTKDLEVELKNATKPNEQMYVLANMIRETLKHLLVEHLLSTNAIEEMPEFITQGFVEGVIRAETNNEAPYYLNN